MTAEDFSSNERSAGIIATEYNLGGQAPRERCFSILVGKAWVILMEM